MCTLWENRINKIFDNSIPPLPSAIEFYNNPDNQSRSVIDTGNPEHGTGKCECCTRTEIVKQNEDIWEQKWKEIQRQERREKEWLRLQQLDENDNHKGDGEAKRWYREREKYEDLKWRFY